MAFVIHINTGHPFEYENDSYYLGSSFVVQGEKYFAIGPRKQAKPYTTKKRAEYALHKMETGRGASNYFGARVEEV